MLGIFLYIKKKARNTKKWILFLVEKYIVKYTYKILAWSLNKLLSHL